MAVPTLRPFASFLIWFCIFAFVALSGSAARGDQSDAPAADKLVGLRLEWHTQQARLEAAGWESDLVAPPRPGGTSVGNFREPDFVLKELLPVLTTDYEALRNAVRKLAEAAATRREEAQKDWAEIYRQRIAFRQYTDQQQAAYHFDFDSGTLPPLRPTVLDTIMVAWAAFVWVMAVRLGRNVQRVAIRKATRATALVVLFGLFSLSGCSSGHVFDGRPWAVREEATLTAEIQDSATKADAATAAANQKWTATVNGWAALVAVHGARGDTVESVLRRGETEVRDRLRAAIIDARLADRLAKEAEAERGQLATDKTKLDDLTSGAKFRAIAFAVVRCVGAVLLLGVAVAPYWRSRRVVAAQVRSDARKCPRCFSEKLIVEKRGSPSGDAEKSSGPRYRGPKAKLKAKPEPVPEEDDGPKETGYIECKSCGFRFRRSYQKVHRLCFPAVGVRSSGKTHMLATAYDRVRKRIAPTAAAVQPAPSLGDARFEQYIDLILTLKREAGGTVHDMPDPVMLHLRDADPAGPNTALVNLFDYSGELVNQSIDRDRLKKQAVKMDGFMLFLDPTQLYGDGTNVTLDRQLSALNEFMADMREARDVPVGQIIPVPVAVCIPKFDLLLTENPIQSQSVPFIRQLLGQMNPPPKQMTLDTLKNRSAVVEEMLELMFRGVDIRALVESYFGGQVMFFPVSSVSLFENELGVKDLSRRTIAPFGVAEPFLWLLHMHGYEVFA